MSSSTAGPSRESKRYVKQRIHPTFVDMVRYAIANLREKNGSTGRGITKYIKENFDFLRTEGPQFVESRIKAALKICTKNGKLVKVSGQGVSAKYTLSDPKTQNSPAKKQKQQMASKASFEESDSEYDDSAASDEILAHEKEPARTALSKGSASKTTAKRSASKTTAKRSASKTTAKRSASKTTAKRSASKKPAPRSSSKTPVKKRKLTEKGAHRSSSKKPASSRRISVK